MAKRATSPKKAALTHPITSEWQERVLAAIERGGRGTHAKLARHLGCSAGYLTDMLTAGETGERRFSQYVAGVHEFFAWPAPDAPVMSLDLGEVRFVLDKMGERGRRLMHLLKDTDAAQQEAILVMLEQLTRANRPG